MTVSGATISLREWIEEALRCSKDSLSISRGSSGRDALSMDYLRASLKVAKELVDEIGHAEDLGLPCGLSMLSRHTSNGSMPDLAEFITVRLKDGRGIGNNEREGQCRRSSIVIEPIPFSTVKESEVCAFIDGGQAQALLDCLANDDESSTESCSRRGSNLSDMRDQYPDKGQYLNVHSANLAAIHKGGDHCKQVTWPDSVLDKQHLIYSLGLVFYEIFSGGERPPTALIVSPSSLVQLCDASRPFDFARSLQVLDNSMAGEECDSYSDTENCGELHGCAERPTEDVCESSNGFQSRKMQITLHHSLRCSERNQGHNEKRAALCRVISRVSIEELKMKGLPGSLCSLIYNMIDCINGDFSGDESYSNISQVSYDLHLMLEYPNVFLRDLDVSTLSLTPLTLKEAVFIRNDEFISLECAYRHSALGSPQIALIAGESGTGKTWLANRMGRLIVSNGGVFLHGKFERLHIGQPFAVLATAFNSYCDMLIQETNRERAKLVASKLQEALGRDACQLVKMIPTLGDIIVYEDCNNDFDGDRNFMDEQQRLYYLMCRFVETISTYSDCVISLFLDDLQWADDVSISIIGEILKAPVTNKRFFFLGCYRDDEIMNDHPFLKIIENIRGFGVAIRTVKLECVDKDTVTRMLSHLLCLSPRLVTSLSDIVYHKTKGNPLFLSQFMLSLNRDGLLYPSLTLRRWQWDEDKIMARSLPDDIAVLLSQRIGRLPPDVKMALYTLSCFGTSIEVDIMKKLESKLGDDLIDPLAVAEKEGFVNKMNAKIFFGHDRILEAAYSLAPPEDRSLHHMKCGLSLADISLNANDNNRLLFIAVEQINRGGPPAVSDNEQRLKIVEYNLTAGKAALDKCDFHLAFNFFDNGISFLKKTHWRDNYDLSLELFELAAECALITGDMFTITVLHDQVTKNARCFEDTLNTSYVRMSTLSYSSKIADAVEMGMETLSKLGEDLPRTLSHAFIKMQIKTTQAMLEKISVIDLLNYRFMSDKKKIIAMKVLRRLYEVVQQVKPNLLPIIPLKMIEITLDHGMSHLSPIAFAFFGSLVAKTGDIKGGYELTGVAKSLLDRMKLRKVTVEVFCVSTDILCFIEPLRLANENRKETEETALAAGDVTWSCYSRVMYATAAFWSGLKLSVSLEVITEARRVVMSRGHVTSDNYLLLVQQSILRLTGCSETEIILDDDLKKLVLDTNNHHALEIYYFQKTYVSFMLDIYDSMKESAVELLKFSAKPWLLMSNHIFHVLIGSLVSFRIYRETKVSFWLERGTKLKSQMKVWTEQGSSWTFENKFFLLEAEEHFSNNRIHAAQAAYGMAISSAKAHLLVNEEALAYELAAKFHFNMTDASTSLEYFTAAHERYIEWGAFAKAKTLFQFIQENFIPCQGALSSPPIGDGAEQHNNSKADQRKRKQT